VIIGNPFDRSQRRGDSSLAIISLLGNNVKAILQVQTIEGNSNLTDITGLTGFQIKLAKEKLRYYSDMELDRMLKVLQYCEKAIKTGLMEADMVIDYLLVNIL
jgi:DNA polymerase III delta subunit